MAGKKKEKGKKGKVYTLVLDVKYRVADLLFVELDSTFGSTNWDMQTYNDRWVLRLPRPVSANEQQALEQRIRERYHGQDGTYQQY